MNILCTHDLTKKYGRITAVNKLNLKVESGSVFGLLGPNGSGKTTTLGMILDVTTPTSGDFLWFNTAPDNEQRKRIGSILEKPNFYPYLSAYKNLELVCKIKDIGIEGINEVLELVGLFDRREDPFKTYSLGMKQRLAIASALIANPEVLILDEPTNGLDPKGIAEIRALILKIAQSDKTIILASHLLDEVQKVCTDFAILNQGKLIHTGKVDTDFADKLLIEVGAEDLDILASKIVEYPNYISHKMIKGCLEIHCAMQTKAADLNKFLGEVGIYPSHLRVVPKTLEQQFMEILNENDS